MVKTKEVGAGRYQPQEMISKLKSEKHAANICFYVITCKYSTKKSKVLTFQGVLSDMIIRSLGGECKMLPFNIHIRLNFAHADLQAY